MTHLETGRRVGKTTAQLNALAAGSVFLVHHARMADYCRQLLRRARRPINDVHFVTPKTLHRVQGLPRDTDIAVDHAFHMLAHSRDRREVRAVMRATFDKFTQ